MKIALSVFKDRISTVFDAADQLLIVESADNGPARKTFYKFSAGDSVQRATELKAQGIDVLICGAISRPMESTIMAQGIKVYSFIRGMVDDILEAYQENRLGQAAFFLPGCSGRGPGMPMCPRREQAGNNGQGRGIRCRLRASRKGT